jgi:integrase
MDTCFHLLSSSPWDMDAYRKRKLRPLLKSLGVKPAGFHGFRHFNVSLLDALRVPLKTIQERLGHAITGSFTLDVYGGTPDGSPISKLHAKVVRKSRGRLPRWKSNTPKQKLMILAA